MSVSKWAYTPKVCDGGGCPGDCDLCNKPRDMEDEIDDYIKREDAIRTMTGRPIIVNQGNVEAVTRIYEEFVKRIDDIPAADVVEVVRCKDCRWYEVNELKSDGTEDKRYKPSMCMLHSRNFRDNYYCADGERADT